MRKNNSHGFTMIELLAVITIMGILLVTSIIGINAIILNSRKNIYVNDAKTYMLEGRNGVVDGRFKIDNPEYTYYIHLKNLADDYDTARSPWANWADAYVAVTLVDVSAPKYYWVSSDKAGWKVDVVREDKINKSKVYNSKGTNINYRVPLDGTKKVMLINENGYMEEVTPYLTWTKEQASKCYSFKENADSLTLTYFKGTEECGTDIVIPSEVGGKVVKEIYQYTFNNKGLTSVFIPDTVEKIGFRAFANNKLTKVHIPSSVKTIDGEAFLSNKISELSMDEGITTTGTNSFRHNLLTAAVIPDSLINLGPCTYCDNLISNPSFLYKRSGDSYDYSVIRGYIGDLSEFKHNKVFVIPAEVNGVKLKTIEYGAFQRMSIRDWEVKIPETVTSIGGSAFYQSYIGKVNLPVGLKTIGSNAFLGNRLTELDIPNTVTSIGTAAFNDNLVSDVNKRYIYKRNSDGSIDYTNLIGYAGAQRNNIPIPDGIKTIGNSTFRELSATGTMVIPKGVVSIGDLAFARNRLTYIDNGDGVYNYPFVYKRNSNGSINYSTLIGYGGYKQSNVVIPNTVKTIGNNTFYYSYMQSVTIPEGVTSIGGSAFEGCQLKEVTIPSTVTSIGANAFRKEISWGNFNSDLTKIINTTGRKFNWKSITGGPSDATFVTGTVENWYGNIEVIK